MQLSRARLLRLVGAALSCHAAASVVQASAQNSEDTASVFTKTDAMIPMRDGARLHTVIFVPREAQGPLPILLERTPYGARDDEKSLRERYWHLIADGYIFAFQDIRGRFKSEGQFVMQRQVRDRNDPAKISSRPRCPVASTSWCLATRSITARVSPSSTPC